ncbi:hypothetical protein N7474_002745 [Penicillium riverlandense]|uniref:uncharacterized protein n=1 Tax=Penicillium riverlandense TaxID=1903569 RepID=UPI0025473135|nr:uncharacterized protein N7474_002745 [Penicillium riverlandense]KAJ5825607.1 hypothetical protein N7474_002745 [Penicillium riverlandense]
MAARTLKLILLLLLQAVLLLSVQADDFPSQFGMNSKTLIWDESCNKANPSNPQESRRAGVERAWMGALELSNMAWMRFQHVTWPIIQRTMIDTTEEKHIHVNDPAYVLLFALDSSKEGRDKILETLKNLNDLLNLGPGDDDCGQVLKISCADTHYMEGEDQCHGAYAATESYMDQDTSVITFCPQFWTKPRFDQLKHNPEEVEARYQNPNYKGTDAETVVHEFSHLWWIGETNADDETVPEVYGLAQCAYLAWNDGEPIPNNEQVIENADTYGYYHEWGYFRMQKIHNLWPQGMAPPKIKIPIQNWRGR